MYEDVSAHAFQRSKSRRSQQPNMVDAAKQKRDDFIMDTNNSSIVSKRSVEKLYYAGEPEYFRFFVNKFKRRSPLINRGYWLRMRAVEHTVQQFLKEQTEKRKLVVNLGCGYDPLPWLFFGKQPALCRDAVFVDVDYPQLMQKKCGVIDKTEELKRILPDLVTTGKTSGLLSYSTNYAAIGCDLGNLEMLRLVLEEHLQASSQSVAVLFVAEVSIAYMSHKASQAVMEWSAEFRDARFCLLEQHLPDGSDHPFAKTMLEHFQKLRTPLHGIGTMAQMRSRFVKAGWPKEEVDIRPLWDLWSDSQVISAEQRQALDKVEPFDEWEEFALFASHYFLLVARTKLAAPRSARAKDLARPAQKILSPVESKLVAVELPEPHSYRRFAATILSSPRAEAAGLHAGLGTQERLTTTDTYVRDRARGAVDGPPLQAGLMCHTITKLGDTDKYLLVGGRSSPDKASADCWLQQAGVWSRTSSLPHGRFRHCAIWVSREKHGPDGVLIYGGKTSDARVLDEPLLWTEDGGWSSLRTLHLPEHAPLPRFGATMTSNFHSPGLLIGGMSAGGTIIEDCWRWEFDIDGSLSWSWMGDHEDAKGRFEDASPYLFRFGAQTTTFEQASHGDMVDEVLVGGIIPRSMLNRSTEVISLTRGCLFPLVGPRPLLVGHGVCGSLILGGGATCFSFGTYWNSGSELQLQAKRQKPTDWRLVADTDSAAQEKQSVQQKLSQYEQEPNGQMPVEISIPRVCLSTAEQFEAILAAGKPVILTGCDIGLCTEKWTPEHLKNSIGADRKVAVHVSPTPKMDFQSKNFHYETQTFGTFLDSAQQGRHLYLRALSATNPSQTPTSLASDFPEIVSDFVLPPSLAYASQNSHSSPLRISGPVTMWLHYDVLANILCQVRGRKRLLLYPPSDVTHLSFPPGASSSSIDVFAADATTHPPLQHVHPHEALLQAGEILFIPPLWLHTAAPTEGLSVAVNVFFRNLDKGYAAGRDVYGNRDVAAYEKGRKDLEKICNAFRGLPVEMRKFYVARLGGELSEMASR